MFDHYLFKHPLKRYAVGCLDAAGSFLTQRKDIGSEPFDPASIKKILAMRLDHLGDVIMVRPALKALRDHFPKAQIDFLVSSDVGPILGKELRLNIIPVSRHWFSRDFSLSSCVQELFQLIPILRHERYDLGIDFRGDFRNIILMASAGIPERLSYPVTGGGFLLTRQTSYDRKLHQVLLNLKLLEPLGIAAKPESHPIPCTDLQKEFFLKAFPEISESARPVKIILHSGAGYPSKKWPQERFRTLIKNILDHHPQAHVILIGTRGEQNSFPVLERKGVLTDLRGRTRIEQLPVLFALSHLYIGNDSGPAHLAAAQGLAGVIIFSGTNDASVWRPWSEKFQLVQHPVPCSPCEAKNCPLGHHDCIEKISVEQVFAAVETALAENSGGSL